MLPDMPPPPLPPPPPPPPITPLFSIDTSTVIAIAGPPSLPFLENRPVDTPFGGPVNIA
uniref:Uncharacterized protein n=1 Tax=uncultured marine virus TaxID=186617 RepID=A0A0F7L431_9VIRU|nr:hypothetical protein [uncultured marine virus]